MLEKGAFPSSLPVLSTREGCRALTPKSPILFSGVRSLAAATGKQASLSLVSAEELATVTGGRCVSKCDDEEDEEEEEDDAYVVGYEWLQTKQVDYAAEQRSYSIVAERSNVYGTSRVNYSFSFNDNCRYQWTSGGVGISTGFNVSIGRSYYCGQTVNVSGTLNPGYRVKIYRGEMRQVQKVTVSQYAVYSDGSSERTGKSDTGRRVNTWYRYSDVIASRFATDHHKIQVSAEGTLEHLDACIHAMSEPMVSHDNIGFYLLSREVAKSTKVVQSGQGADELLCGYKKYMAFHIQSLVKQGRVFAGAGMLIDSLRNGTVMRQFNMQEARRYLPWARSGGEDSVLGPALRDLPRVPVGMGGMSMQERQALDVTSLSVPPLCHYEDRMSMAHGREIRLPFLDVRLMDLLIGLPTSLKLRDGWTKWVFRKAMEAELPREIAWRKDKQGFSLPQSVWLRGPLRERILELFSEDALVFQYGLLDRERLLAKYSRFVEESEGRGGVWYQDVFNAISVEIWLRSVDAHVRAR